MLYIVATPIGNLEDISHRALSVLHKVDVIAAEDTRHSARLLAHYGIKTPLLSYHQFNEAQRIDTLLARLARGECIALISDAGTPLISDPGYRLVYAARQHGIPVSPIPGACALISALSASGLPSERFIFEGFLSTKQGARQEQLSRLLYETRTIILYEAPHRILSLAQSIKAVFPPERNIVIARELSKQFETIHSDKVGNLPNWLESDNHQQKGEFVVLIAGAPKLATEALDAESLRILKVLMSDFPTKQAATLAAKITQKSKNLLYKAALALKST